MFAWFLVLHKRVVNSDIIAKRKCAFCGFWSACTFSYVEWVIQTVSNKSLYSAHIKKHSDQIKSRMLPYFTYYQLLLFLEPRYIQQEQTNQAEEVEEEDLFGGFSKLVRFFFSDFFFLFWACVFFMFLLLMLLLFFMNLNFRFVKAACLGPFLLDLSALRYYQLMKWCFDCLYVLYLEKTRKHKY